MASVFILRLCLATQIAIISAWSVGGGPTSLEKISRRSKCGLNCRFFMQGGENEMKGGEETHQVHSSSSRLLQGMWTAIVSRRGFGRALIGPLLAPAACQPASAATTQSPGIEATAWQSSPKGEGQGDENKKKFIKTDSGLKYYDITEGTGEPIRKGCKVNFHFKGRLAGRNGKQYEDTSDGEPVRATLGQGQLIQGLEEGLIGVRQGGSRRILIPSVLGYVDKKVGPIPRDYGMRNRLYSTVMNKERTDKEKKALGADIAAEVPARLGIFVLGNPRCQCFRAKPGAERQLLT